jgi:hypothetical protein
MLKTLVPSYAHPMQDVAINWASLWFAAQKKNWPLARYFYNEARSHIAWTVRINPNDKVNGEIVDLKSIYDRHRHQQPDDGAGRDREAELHAVRRRVQDDARELLLMPQGGGQTDDPAGFRPRRC